jgi:hypothetical protein
MGKRPLDPIERARLARELEEREARRGHEAYESSEPPPPDNSWPPAPIVRPMPPPPYRERMSSVASITKGIDHVSHGVSAISKRVAVVLAVWGSVSWVAAVALTYWTSHNVISLDRYAKDEAERTAHGAALGRDIEGLRGAINDLRVQIAAMQGQLNARNQESIKAERRPR